MPRIAFTRHCRCNRICTVRVPKKLIRVIRNTTKKILTKLNMVFLYYGSEVLRNVICYKIKNLRSEGEKNSN